MIEIKKSKEPNKLLVYRCQTDACYDNMPKDVREAVLNSLMEEQGHLCAYSMKKIPEKKKKPDVTIEHWNAQSKNDIKMGLDYHNMLAVCSGNRGCRDLTCDAKKGDKSIVVNPLNPATLESIEYRGDGRIYSKDEVIDKDLNERLNLNCESVLLPDCRKEALLEIQRKVLKDNKGKTASKEYFQRLLDKFTQPKSKKSQYAGIIINWLEKKVK